MPELKAEAGVTGPLVRLRIAPSRSIWRIGPAWSVLGGALVAGVPVTGAAALFRLAAAAILGDLLWGALRQLAPDGPGGAEAPAARSALPYARADAPLATFLAALARRPEGVRHAPEQALLIGLALTAAVSVLLGPAALFASALAALVVIGVGLRASRSAGVALGEALLDVMLPWLLGAGLAGAGAVSGQVMALAGAFTLLQWGAARAERASTLPAWLGQGAVLAVLIATRQPWALAGVAALFAPRRGGWPRDGAISLRPPSRGGGGR